MAKHVDLLGLLYMVWGFLSLLVSGALLALGLGAAAIATSAASAGRGTEMAAWVTAATFAVLAAGFLLWAIAHVAGGFAVRGYRSWGRPLGLMLGILNLFLLPFGTALGIYAFWVLINDQTRGLFEPPRPSAGSAI